MTTGETMSKKEGNGAPVCGVLFCGGCNPRYDRMRFFEDVRKALKDPDGERLQFVFYEKGMSCDGYLLINGCTSECLLGEIPREKAVVASAYDVQKTAGLIRERFRLPE